MSLRRVRTVLSGSGRTVAVRYLLVATAANLAWEILQLPFYTIWQTASKERLVFAVVHCTVGDLIVLAAALIAALLLTGNDRWPRQTYARVALVATLLGAAYTVFSEWLNVGVWRNWAYASGMPLLPPLGTGLSPFLQWLVIPPLAYALAGFGLVQPD